MVKVLFKVLSLLYSAIGTDINSDMAASLKLKAENNFALWCDKCSENPEMLIKAFKSCLIILLIFEVFIYSFLIRYINDYTQDFFKAEFLTILTLTICLRTQNDFFVGTKKFFNKIFKNRSIILALMAIYTAGCHLKNGINIHTQFEEEIMAKYILNAWICTIAIIVILYAVCHLLPFLVSKAIESIASKIIIRSNSFPDKTPIKHLLRYGTYLFLISSMIYCLIVYMLNTL